MYYVSPGKSILGSQTRADYLPRSARVIFFVNQQSPISGGGLAGGGLKMGQVIGESSPRIEVPKSATIRPQDVMATVLEMYGIGHRVQFVSPQGRPTYMIEDGKPIAELI